MNNARMVRDSTKNFISSPQGDGYLQIACLTLFNMYFISSPQGDGYVLRRMEIKNQIIPFP